MTDQQQHQQHPHQGQQPYQQYSQQYGPPPGYYGPPPAPPMSAAITVIATAFLGVFGIIVAIIGANQCARVGQNGGKHFAAFFLTLGVWVALAAAIILNA